MSLEREEDLGVKITLTKAEEHLFKMQVAHAYGDTCGLLKVHYAATNELVFPAGTKRRTANCRR